MELHEIINFNRKPPYFSKMRVESGFLYNFHMSEGWIFVPDHQCGRITEEAQPAVGGGTELDYTLKNKEIVWFTYKTNPQGSDDWIEAEILDLNWALKAAAVQLKGYKGVTCCNIASLSRAGYCG